MQAPPSQSAAPDPARPALALRIGRIAPVDAAKIHAFLPIAGQRLTARWRIVVDGHADVLVLDGHDAPTTPGLLDEPRLVLRIVERLRADDDRRRTLARPLQYQDLVDALIDAERTLDAAATRTSTRLGADESYRLIRWPPRAMLMADAQRLRLASLIVVRHLSLDELVRLGGASRDACSSFIAELDAAGLVDVQRSVAAPAAPARPVAPALEPIGLFDRIRRRLGLRSSTA